MKIAISSGKGGTGKTTLSVNLASYLAEKEEVVLADLDVEEPNSGLFLKGDKTRKEIKYRMVPEWDRDKCKHSGTCKEVCNFNAVIRLGDEVIIFPEMCHSCYACVELCESAALKMIPHRIGELSTIKNGRLSFIESRLDIGQEQAVPLIAQTKEYLDKNFPSEKIIFFDSPPGTSCPVIESIKDADLVILVTEPTPFGLHDLKLAVDTVEEMHKKYAVVINRFGIGNNSVTEYCMSKDIPVIAKIPNSRRVAELYSKGELLYDKVPEFREQLEKIESYIRGMEV